MDECQRLSKQKDCEQKEMEGLKLKDLSPNLFRLSQTTKAPLESFLLGPPLVLRHEGMPKEKQDRKYDFSVMSSPVSPSQSGTLAGGVVEVYWHV